MRTPAAALVAFPNLRHNVPKNARRNQGRRFKEQPLPSLSSSSWTTRAPRAQTGVQLLARGMLRLPTF
jgi:hypothetical protein